MLNRLASNIHFIFHATCETVVLKDYVVVFSASRFACVMMCPNLMKAQRKGIPLTQGIRTISIKALNYRKYCC